MSYGQVVLHVMVLVTSMAADCDVIELLQRPNGEIHQNISVLLEGERETVGPACSEGKLLPNIFVLGTQKAGTCTIGHALRKAGITSSSQMILGGGETRKESQIVALHFSDFAKEDLTDIKIQKRFATKWFGFFPSCSEENILRVTKQGSGPRIAEMSPIHLSLTKPHFGDDLAPLYVNREGLRPGLDLLGFDLPPVLRYVYGPAHLAVRFCVTLREPLSRMQSDLYMEQRRHEIQSAPEVLKADLQAFIDNRTASFRLWRALYGRQLREWFAYWPAPQFLVFPYKLMKSHTDALCKSVEKHVQTPLDCQHFRKTSFSRPHNSLEEDLPNSLQKKAEQALKGELELLVNVLLKAHSEGATLPVLEPKPHVSAQDVRMWLVNEW